MKNNFKQAYKYSKINKVLSDNLKKEENSAKITRIEMKYKLSCCDFAEILDRLGLYSKITYKELKICLEAAGINTKELDDEW